MYRIVLTIAVSFILLTSTSTTANQFNKIHLSFDYGFSFNTTNDDIQTNFYSSSLFGTSTFLGIDSKFPYSTSKNMSVSAELMYRWDKKWQAGLGVYSSPKASITGFGGSDILSVGPYEETEATIYYVALDYILAPADLINESRWEFSAGGGVSYASLKVGGDMGSIYVDPILLKSESWEIGKDKIGGVMRATLDYYILASTSLRLKTAVHLVPTVNVPALSFRSRELKDHSVNYSSFNIILSLGTHF